MTLLFLVTNSNALILTNPGSRLADKFLLLFYPMDQEYHLHQICGLGQSGYSTRPRKINLYIKL